MMLSSLFFVVGSINCKSIQDFLFEHPELEIQQANAYKAYRNTAEYQSEQEALNIWGPIYRNEVILVNGRNLKQLREECMAMERQGNKNSSECALFHEWKKRSNELEKKSRQDLDRARELLRKTPEYFSLVQLNDCIANDYIASEATEAQ